MQQYFIDKKLEIGMIFNFENKDDQHHLLKVMRAKVGDQVEVVSEEKVYICQITETQNDLKLEVIELKEHNAEFPFEVTIIQGLPKKDKLELIVQKATELGVHTIIPWQASRSIVKYDDKKAKQKIERWQKIAKEAAEQAHRNRVPQVENVCTTKQMLQSLSDYDVVFIGSERVAKDQTTDTRLSRLLSEKQTMTKVACVIGPEGGFSDEEFAMLVENGATEASFGPRILRTETASLFFLSALSIIFE